MRQSFGRFYDEVSRGAVDSYDEGIPGYAEDCFEIFRNHGQDLITSDRGCFSPVYSAADGHNTGLGDPPMTIRNGCGKGESRRTESRDGGGEGGSSPKRQKTLAPMNDTSPGVGAGVGGVDVE